MIKHNPLFAAILSLSVLSAMPVFAQEKDVDQADSLDFEAFHKDKKAAVKVWQDGADATKNTVKAYEQTPSGTAAASPTATTATDKSTTAPSKTIASPATNTANKAVDNSVKAGQRYEIRERYTLTNSTKTPYSAFYVIEPMYKQAAQLCARGWKKLSERSEPIEQDYYLYYELECL